MKVADAAATSRRLSLELRGDAGRQATEDYAVGPMPNVGAKGGANGGAGEDRVPSSARTRRAERATKMNIPGRAPPAAAWRARHCHRLHPRDWRLSLGRSGLYPGTEPCPRLRPGGRATLRARGGIIPSHSAAAPGGHTVLAWLGP